jgi:DNA replication protein DnaC
MDREGLKLIVGIQPDHHQSLLSTFENRYTPELYKQLTEIADQIIGDKLEKRFVFLLGTPGSGKTHYMVGCFRSKVLADGGVIGAQHSLYMPFSLMVSEIIAGFSETHSTRMGLAQYLPVKYLFLDDISRGERVINPEKMEGQIFRDVLLDRWENCKHLICTSNYDKATLRRMIKTVFGEYVLSRVEGSSMFIQFPEKDFRKK